MSESTTKQTWSILVPCYNEKGTIEDVVSKIKTVLDQIASSYEIIPVDDASTDGSTEIIKRLEEQFDFVRPIYHTINQGIGPTLREGYFTAQYENVASIPGDAQFDPNEFLAVKDFQEKTFVSFFRKENLTYSFFRNKLSYVNKMINKFLIGLDLKDVNWVMVYKRKELENLDLQLSSTLIKSEICAKMLSIGYKAVEIESVYQPRVYGESKGSSKKMIKQALKETFKLYRSLKKFKK